MSFTDTFAGDQEVRRDVFERRKPRKLLIS
jgi:hypothetical protein